MSTVPPARPGDSRIKTITMVVIGIGLVVPAMLGFAAKFIEFIHIFRDRSDGIFAITPITNYLLASLGFFCMLVWATLNGMFHDIEQPKYSMLEREEQLDRSPSP